MLREGQRRWFPVHAPLFATALLAAHVASASAAAATRLANPASTSGDCAAGQSPADTRPSSAAVRSDTARVSGRLVAHDGRLLSSATVIMSPDQQHEPAGAKRPVARLDPDGNFVFEEVPPGRYLIHARGESAPNAPSLFATFALTVAGRDIGGLIMTLTPGGVLEGRLELRAEHGAAKPAGALRVRAPLADGAAFGDTLSGTVEPDGRFRLSGLMPGSHVLMVEGLTFPWRIAAARLHGRDIAETTFDLERDQQIRDVQVLVTDSAGGLSGAIALPPDTEPQRVLVVALPRDPLRRRVPLRFVRTTRPASDSTYRLIDLVPGEHLVVAAVDLAEPAIFDAMLLERLADVAIPVTVRDAEITAASLKAVRLLEP